MFSLDVFIQKKTQFQQKKEVFNILLTFIFKNFIFKNLDLFNKLI